MTRKGNVNKKIIPLSLALLSLLGIIYLIFDWTSPLSIFNPDRLDTKRNLMVYSLVLALFQILAIVLSWNDEKSSTKILVQVVSWIGLVFVIVVSLLPFLGVPGIGLL